MPALTEYLPYEEIKRLYPTHHLLLAPFEKGTDGEITFGSVWAAAENPNELRFSGEEIKAMGIRGAAFACTKVRDSNKCYLL